MLGAVLAALMIGFLVGLLSFKVKVRWCPSCGSSTLPTRPEDQKVGGRRV